MRFQGFMGTRWGDFSVVKHLVNTRRRCKRLTLWLQLASSISVYLAIFAMCSSPVTRVAIACTIAVYCVLFDWLSAALLFGFQWQAIKAGAAVAHESVGGIPLWAAACAAAFVLQLLHGILAGTRQQTTSLNGGIWFAEALFDALVSPAFLLLHVLIALGYTPQLHALNDPAGLRTGATHSLRHES